MLRVFVQDGARTCERLIDADLCRAEGPFLHFVKKRQVTIGQEAASGGIWPFHWSVPARATQSTVEDFVTAIATHRVYEISPASGTLAEGGGVKQAPAAKPSGPALEEGDAQ